jgi:glycosyltransferase involved in cell wall biosynthesis
MEVVPNGIDPEAHTPASEGDRAAARRRLGLDDVPLVVCVGRLTRAKGQDLLLDAWPSVRTEVPEARLILVGDGPEERILRDRRGPGVRLVGRRDDVPEWLAAADVVAIPSRWEGMSLVMLEAMARGRSVVSTDVAGARDALEDGAGEVVAGGDGGALARSLARRLLAPEMAAAEGRLGRARVEERYPFSRTVDLVEGVYGRVGAPSA